MAAKQGAAPRPCEGMCLGQCCGASYYAKEEGKEECPCELVRCPNYELCRQMDPLWVIKCYGGRCSMCDVRFGKNLAFSTGSCAICMEDNKRLAQFPNCVHSICVACFSNPKSGLLPPHTAAAFHGPDDHIYVSESESDSDEEPPEYRAKPCPLCRGSVSHDWSKGRPPQ